MRASGCPRRSTPWPCHCMRGAWRSPRSLPPVIRSRSSSTRPNTRGADGLFVGARGLSRVERFLLGSVSNAVAARAHCSVEVVRPA